jgi:hypothetical protein
VYVLVLVFDLEVKLFGEEVISIKIILFFRP